MTLAIWVPTGVNLVLVQVLFGLNAMKIMLLLFQTGKAYLYTTRPIYFIYWRERETLHYKSHGILALDPNLDSVDLDLTWLTSCWIYCPYWLSSWWSLFSHSQIVPVQRHDPYSNRNWKIQNWNSRRMLAVPTSLKREKLSWPSSQRAWDDFAVFNKELT